MSGWIGVDLDGTLARYDGWRGADHIGDPIPAMANRVMKWRGQGKEVKIFTARICDGKPETKAIILRWLRMHGFGELEITNVKDYGMIELWDDRAVQVIPNTGLRVDGKGD